MSAADKGAREQQRTAFGEQVDPGAYDQFRPGYPDRVIDWILDRPTTRLRVVDLGAGTGKLTEVITQRGHEAVAVEPSEGKLARFSEGHPGVEAHLGSGESIPLPDNSVDAVIAAQSWHWVDEGKACAEIARVLRPGGRVGIVWNVRDEQDPWVKELNEAVGRRQAIEEAAAPRPKRPTLTNDFSPVEEWTVENVHALPSAEALVGLVSTWSYVQLAGDPMSALTLAREIASRQAYDDGTVVMPQNCVAYRAHKV